MMKLKPLARNTFGIVAATTVAGLGLGAAPASADITNLKVVCDRWWGGATPCDGSDIILDATDSTPVWITVNGTALAGSPFSLQQANPGYHIQLFLDCRMTPLHVVAMQKSASGTITSQQSTDFTPPTTVGNAVLGDLFSGSSIGSAQVWQALTGNNTPNVGSASGSAAAANDANVGSAESAGCHVTGQ
ncbi:hypothetical protein ACFXG4_32530 [Nocardia sp. NPDC059246]|uniref:hypothetical protein n=1 Tax=unclassified Nocardia TaxID=2637762 RepID=UPI0036B242FC